MRSPLARFIAASGLTNLGDGIALVAWAWLATQLTRDPLLIALVPVALKAPWFVFSLPAGLLIDRMDRRRAILAADLIRVIAYASAAIAVWMALPFDPPPLRGTDQPVVFALIAICAITVGAAEVLRDNAAQTILPALIPEEGLERANGRLWSVEMVMNLFVGTALAGVLIGISLALPFAVNAAAMALAVGLVLCLHGDFRADVSGEPTQDRNWRLELREGIAFLLGQPILRGLALLTGFFNFAFEAMMVTLVLIVQERLQLGPLALSAIMASGAVGGVAAGLVNDRIVTRLGRSRVLQAAMISTFAFPLTVLLSGSGFDALILICAGFLVSEFWGVLWNTVSVSYRQRHIPRRLLGRVNSAYRLFAIGMAPFAMLIAGLLTRGAGDLFGREFALTVPFWLAMATFATITLIYWRFLGRSFETR
ncbi:MFS transporter [Paracoccus alkanivorans]|uniref:MFS transporter n=1 Tax=Paracoccus alkanivorans TaxID=2116655 RepID=A0A3M0M8W4_9RHOB|nr:MFS transporter [Paracoccus alkanivorans]RMC32010.1 MFS transporter [Paracoccus alkanivorans]